MTAEEAPVLERPHLVVGVLASLAAAICLLIAADHAIRQAKDPDAVASQHCGGALGGGPAGGPDTSACYLQAVDRSPVGAAEPWLAIGVGCGLLALVCLSVGVVRWSSRTTG